MIAVINGTVFWQVGDDGGQATRPHTGAITLLSTQGMMLTAMVLQELTVLTYCSFPLSPR